MRWVLSVVVEYPLLTALAGHWRGEGAGTYPTIAEFAYLEELLVEPIQGRPVAHWQTRTTDVRTGEPRHCESGFLRVTPAGAELVVAHTFGTVEISTGPAVEPELALASAVVWSSPTAKPIDRVMRTYRLAGDQLTYQLSMAAVGVSLATHLAATLTR